MAVAPPRWLVTRTRGAAVSTRRRVERGRRPGIGRGGIRPCPDRARRAESQLSSVDATIPAASPATASTAAGSEKATTRDDLGSPVAAVGEGAPKDRPVYATREADRTHARKTPNATRSRRGTPRRSLLATKQTSAVPAHRCAASTRREQRGAGAAGRHPRRARVPAAGDDADAKTTRLTARVPAA